MNTETTISAPVINQAEERENWTKIIEPRTSLLDLRLNDLWQYRDLVMMFIRRDFVSNFKQTILGPLWFFIQPLLTTLTYVVIFGRVAKLSTDGIPMLLFYLSGITIWNYFSETLTRTSGVFRENANLFGKVYFPRLTMPVSIVISNLLRFVIQFILFLIIWIYFLATTNTIQPNVFLLLTPLLILIMGLLALGFGMIISALTTKYKDLTFLVTFSIQLLMFATPVIYPMSSVPDQYKTILAANPISAVIETFRFGFLGSGYFSWGLLLYSFVFSLVIMFLGVIVFNRVEKKFTDII
mgnify:CR=1 FL=1